VDSFVKSLEWCLIRAPRNSAVVAFPLMLLRGTPLYEAKERLGLVESSDIVATFAGRERLLEGIPHVIASPSFTMHDWFKMGDLARSVTLDGDLGRSLVDSETMI
jgi:hypothetical protein